MTRKSKEIPFFQNTYTLICEGNSEINYFNELKVDLRVPFITIVPVSTTKKDPVNIVNQAIKTFEENKRIHNFQSGDKYFCIFDLDHHSEKEILKAYELIKSIPQIEIIFSNPSLEIWFLLHFEKGIDNISNKKLCEKLGEKLGEKYSKSKIKKYYKTYFKKLINTAIKNSENQKKILKNDSISEFSKKSIPYTQIDIFISDLNKLKKDFYQSRFKNK